MILKRGGSGYLAVKHEFEDKYLGVCVVVVQDPNGKIVEAGSQCIDHEPLMYPKYTQRVFEAMQNFNRAFLFSGPGKKSLGPRSVHRLSDLVWRKETIPSVVRNRVEAIATKVF